MRIVVFLLLCCLFACRETGEKQGNLRMVTDGLGRQVVLADTVKRVVCIRSSAIRLVTYAGGASFICGVEEQEQRKGNEYTHLFAHPELTTLPMIGPRMGGDAELILSVKPDLIFMASTTRGEADELQQRIGIPVFAIDYGDLGGRRAVFYQSLRQLGCVLRTEREVEQLIRYIELQIKELQQRLQGMERFRSVYVGAISYRGRHGLTSTDPHYAALDFLGVPHVASRMDTAQVSAITGAYIDWEQLLEWNPELIFVDANGWSLVQQELQSRPEIFRILTAYRTKQLYLLWPYNNYHSNFEVMLANAWYLGKVLSPDRFADVVLREKVNEIMMHFVGDTIVGALEKCWGNYRNLLEE